jgi:acyl-CoA dehydrogenase
LQSEGVLFKGPDGKLAIRLNWNKRWITLAAISTILGLAFRLRDPENLLGKGEDVGITCALIPTTTPGVVIGRRHDPLNVPFYNCPTQGKDVVISVEDHVVGGVEGCGIGWSMLMDCLSAGRGISLPAQSAGGGKYYTRIITNHATIRKQFGVSIGKFEGVEEPIARVAGYSYLLEALRRFTLGALDKGIKPPVITAIAKYHSTELQRKMVNDTMDVLGGAAISNGPRNLVAHSYIATPIGITVEGANILTRTLIIFGQGALRAHPYAFKELNALEKNDVRGFDDAFWGHIGHVIRNIFRAVLLSLTRGWISTPKGGWELARYYRKLNWISATFATMSDIAMASLGGGLKAKEKITGRYADILSWMYIATSVLRRFEADGRRKEDLPFVHFALKHALTQIQVAFDGIFANLNVPLLSWFFRGPIRAWSNLNSVGEDLSDELTHKIVKLSLADSEQRNRLTEGIYIPKNPEEALARQERAYKLAKKAEEAERKIRKAVRKKILPKKKSANLVAMAFEKGVITADDKAVLEESVQAVWDAIQVDDFSQEEYVKRQLVKPQTFKLVSGK